MMRRLSYRLSNSVVWESQNFSIIREKLVSLFFAIRVLKIFVSTKKSPKNYFKINTARKSGSRWS